MGPKETDTFQEFFDAAIESAAPERPREIARYWARRRGRGEPTEAEVAREMAWESIVRAHERGEGFEVELTLGPEGWIATIGAAHATVPERYAVLADPPLEPGRRRMKVVQFDRLLEELELRPILPGESS